MKNRCVILVRNAMYMHPQDPEVQTAACKALKNFWFAAAKFLLSAEAVKAICVAIYIRLFYETRAALSRADDDG